MTKKRLAVEFSRRIIYNRTMKDLIEERDKKDKMKHSIVKWWNVHYMTPEELEEEQAKELTSDVPQMSGDLDAAQAYGINVISALGLPGRYTTKSSAMVLAEAIRKKTRSVRGVKEEKSWIYQILPSDMV